MRIFRVPALVLVDFHNQLHIGSPLELAVYVQHLILKVNVPQGKPTEFRYVILFSLNILAAVPIRKARQIIKRICSVRFSFLD